MKLKIVCLGIVTIVMYLLFLPCLLAWRSDTDPGSNTEHNSIGPVSEKNFAGSELKTKRVLLLSLQKGGPVTFPGPNLGHNSVGPIGKKNFDGSKLKNHQVFLPSLGKEPVNSPAPSPIHNHPVSTFSEKNIASSKLRSQQDLLPSLQKGGPVTSPGPNRGHNSAPIPSPNPVSTFNKKNSLTNELALHNIQKSGYFFHQEACDHHQDRDLSEILKSFPKQEKPPAGLGCSVVWQSVPSKEGQSIKGVHARAQYWN
nr:formin-like protein 20 [Ipomoea batatas]